MSSDDHPGSRELRSFGRRRGRRPSPRQSSLLRDVLPRVSVDLSSPPPTASFPPTLSPSPQGAGEIWLEIGFGGGEHLLWQARHHPQTLIIGCEPYRDGVLKVLAAVHDDGLSNVRVHADDARDLLRWLPQSSIGRAFILFPDPWPKKRHVKRRLVATPLLDQLARVLKSGAELRLATDIGDYARTVLLAASPHPAFVWAANGPGDWRQRPADWPETRYEQKALREGRRGYFFTFRRV